MAEYHLLVNGVGRTVEVTPDTPLLWVLRDALGLVGTKFGCGQSLCGACTVHVDGRPRRSCTLPIAELGAAPVTTIEGLSPDGSHPVQRAWVDLDVPQCGWCQAGQIMTAAALVAERPSPTEDEIVTAMNGHLCRCGTYARVRRAVHRAAELARGRSDGREA
jgi:isoquinoline 1-oxidoreductase alpha subunit